MTNKSNPKCGVKIKGATMDGNIAAVLTGDLIGSSKANQRAIEDTMEAIALIAERGVKRAGKDIRFARFRGDGWQMYTEDGRLVFRLVFEVLALLRAMDLLKTRISAATGSVSVMPESGLESANGEVFIASGRGLDQIKRKTLTFIDPDNSAGQKAMFSYLAWQASRWSRMQAEVLVTHLAVFPQIHGHDEVETLSHKAGVEPIRAAIRSFEGR